MQTLRRLLAALVLMGLAMPLLAATGLRPQLETAVTHAKFAVAAPSIKMTHLHLHHVVNCLVGAQGKGFDAQAGNPCKGKGNGAIMAASASQRPQLKRIVHEAEKGIAAQQDKQALKVAGETATDLQAFLKSLPSGQ